MLQKRISEKVDPYIHQMQFGFRKNRGTTDALACIRRVIDKGEITRNKTFNDSQINNKILERCQLCTAELVKKNDWIKKGLVEKSSSCYPEGDFHDFYHNSWVISIIPPDGLLDECYIDLLAPKER